VEVEGLSVMAGGWNSAGLYRVVPFLF